MPLYSNTDITNIINLANTTIWKLVQKSQYARIMKGQDVYEGEAAIIYAYRRAIEWGRQFFSANDDFNALCAYLLHKCQGYGFNAIQPYFGSPFTSTSGSGGNTMGNFQFHSQYKVGDPGAPPAGATTLTDATLKGKNVITYLDEQRMPIGLSDRVSITYDIINGIITWNQPLGLGQLITIDTWT